MASFLVLFGFTDKGAQNIKDSPARVKAARKVFSDVGAKVKDFYLVMGFGHYDTLFLVEAPDEETVAKATIKISSLGFVRTDTHRVFSEAEFAKLVADL